MNREKLAIIKDASEGKLTINQLHAIATSVEALDRFAKEVSVCRSCQQHNCYLFGSKFCELMKYV